MENREKYETLKKELEAASKEYYVNNNSIMSDEEFDKKMKELEKLEEELGITDANSLTQKPGSDVVSANDANRHGRPMLSLENTYSIDDVTKWYNDMIKTTGDPNLEVVVNPKWDGGSGALRVQEGKLIKALTRGDGIVGEDITVNTSTLYEYNHYGIDLSNRDLFSGEARGEIIMTREGFDILNADGKYQNARNLACGSMKLLDPEVFKERAPHIKFVAYWLEDSENEKYEDDLDQLANYFDIGTVYYVCHNLEEIMDAIKKIKEDSANYLFGIDGAVMKVNEKKYWQIIGSTAKCPKWAKAYKYEQETAETRVLSFDYQVGRTGKITPVANLKPVFIDGSLVSRVTLNNFDFMSKLDIRENDFITIHKAAAIIPEVVSVNKSKRTKSSKKPDIPTKCPCCGSNLTTPFGFQDSFCMNKDCQAKVLGKLNYFCHTMEIDGLADKTLELFYNEDLIKSIKDIYELVEEDQAYVAYKIITSIDGIGTKTADNITNEIRKSISQEYWKIIAALGIPGVGKKTARLIVSKYQNIDDLMNSSIIELMSIDGIGDNMAADIYKWFREQENINLIKYLKSIGMKLSSELKSGNKLAGKKICVTGALNGMSREEFETLVANNGGSLTSSVSKATNYLVTNNRDSGSSKNKKAQELNIPILTQEEFMKLL